MKQQSKRVAYVQVLEALHTQLEFLYDLAVGGVLLGVMLAGILQLTLGRSLFQAALILHHD